MLQYLDREAFPKLGVEFCQTAKLTSHFLGQKITTHKKGKPNYILANLELLLISSIIMDLISNGNHILSYEYDGIIFEGILPSEKLVVYNKVCKNLFGFIIPFSTEELYSSVGIIGQKPILPVWTKWFFLVGDVLPIKHWLKVNSLKKKEALKLQILLLWSIRS